MDSRPKSIRWLERLSIPLELLGLAIGLGMAWYFLDTSLVALTGAAVGMGAATFWRPIKRRYGINNGWGKLIIGFGLLGLGIYGFTLPDATAALISGIILIGFALTGGWLTLDALYDFRTGTGANESGLPTEMEQFGDSAIVGRTLEDEPHSIGELDSRLELSRRRIESALDMLTTIGAAAERDGYYYATLEDRTLSNTLRDTPSRFTDRVRRVPERLVRPFRLFDS